MTPLWVGFGIAEVYVKLKVGLLGTLYDLNYYVGSGEFSLHAVKAEAGVVLFITFNQPMNELRMSLRRELWRI